MASRARVADSVEAIDRPPTAYHSALPRSNSHGRMLSRLPPLENGAQTVSRAAAAASRSDPSHAKSKNKSVSAVSLLPLPTPHVLQTLFWVFLAAVVAVTVAFARGWQRALEFTTAYIVEYSLSVDNLFVFLLIFRYFKVPRDTQQTVLRYGIVGAMVLRGIMIVAGKALIDKFQWLAIAFAILLIYSAVKLLLEDDDDADLEDNRIIAFSRNVLPVTEYYAGDKFLVHDGTRTMVTPLMVVLVAIELSDVVFALDSVPAVLGISGDTFVVYTSNILAIMGLRSLFFVLSNTIGTLRFLKQSLSIVLAFIGAKMIAGCFGFDFGVAVSLSVVTVTLAVGIVLSLLLPERKDAPLSPSNSV
ncbi:Integral membrane protein TerC [Gracilaria domingensis]|nr:Integral membrane protein TerC [Gracilaria domingensis]